MEEARRRKEDEVEEWQHRVSLKARVLVGARSQKAARARLLGCLAMLYQSQSGFLGQNPHRNGLALCAGEAAVGLARNKEPLVPPLCSGHLKLFSPIRQPPSGLALNLVMWVPLATSHRA